MYLRRKQTSMKRTLLTAFISCLISISIAQPMAPVGKAQRAIPENDFQSANNPYYWKNRLPYPGYWQQDVHYIIDAEMDEVADVVSGAETLIYTNNSPDTLKEVYFHLYQNAFQPGSYLDGLNNANNFHTKWGTKYESKGLGTAIESIQYQGEILDKSALMYDNTILRIRLPHPIAPNAQVRFEIGFKTYFDSGSQRRRMKKFDVQGHHDEAGYRHYDGVHWYPRICVYDRKMGWDRQQHLGKEFYGDYGCFDFSMTISSNYVMEATGAITNEAEVLPKELREKLDIKNFVKAGTKLDKSVLPYVPGQKKTWRYHAINVHDVAWTADPSYRIGEANWNGIRIISLAQEGHAWGWQNAADYTAKVIAYYSTRVGMYAYPKMVVADAQDGMEYPMLTLDGGWDPNYRDLLAHEVGHNWFFGMVGNNETYRAMLDEGFTQFLNTNACMAIDGPKRIIEGDPKSYGNKHRQTDFILNSETYNGYMSDAIRQDNSTLNTHSDDFNSALGHGGGYRNVYFKTSTMLFNLQYVLGDSLFWGAFSNYFNQYKIAHPYPEDFRQSIIDYTKVDLNWFFDQWMETSKTIDYSVAKTKALGHNTYNITLERKGEMQMPIDLLVTDESGLKYAYHIPNTWFEKKTTATILPKWTGWGKLNETYTFKVQLQDEIEQVIIDTTKRLADVWPMDNYLEYPTKLRFDYMINQPNNRSEYKLSWRPIAWWNAIDGVKAGAHFEGGYMGLKHNFNANLYLNTHALNTIGWYNYRFAPSPYYWYNTYYTPLQYNKPGFDPADSRTAIDQFNQFPIMHWFNYQIQYSTITPKFINNSSISLGSRLQDGFMVNTAQFQYKHKSNSTWNFGVTNYFLKDRNYLSNKNLWGYQSYLNNLPPIYFYSFAPITDLYFPYYRGMTSPMLVQHQHVKAYLSHDRSFAFDKGWGLLQSTFTVGVTNDEANYGNGRFYASQKVSYQQSLRINKLEWRMKAVLATMQGSIPNESAIYVGNAAPEEWLDNKYVRANGFGIPVNQNINTFAYDPSQANNIPLQIGGGLMARNYYSSLFVMNMGSNLNNLRGRSGFGFSNELEFDDYIKIRPKATRNWLHFDSYLYYDFALLQTDYGMNTGSILTPFASMIEKPFMDAGLGLVATIKRFGKLETAKPISIRADFPLWLNSSDFSFQNTNYWNYFTLGVSRNF